MTAAAERRARAYLRAVQARRAASSARRGRKGAGCRAYLAVRGRLRRAGVPGLARHVHARPIRRTRGSRTPRRRRAPCRRPANAAGRASLAPDESAVFDYPEVWEIGVLRRPARRAGLLHRRGHRDFYGATWQVHYNSDRTGVRLIGPKPQWARTRRRRSGPASLEHPRQRLRGRRRRLHRRHARDPRAGRSEPRRLRVSGRRSRAPSDGRWASSRRATGCASCRCGREAARELRAPRSARSNAAAAAARRWPSPTEWRRPTDPARRPEPRRLPARRGRLFPRRVRTAGARSRACVSARTR